MRVPIQRKLCPFVVGDLVIYRPSQKLKELTVMYSDNLIPGKEYKVAAVVSGLYVVVEGVQHQHGGLYWDAFELVK